MRRTLLVGAGFFLTLLGGCGPDVRTATPGIQRLVVSPDAATATPLPVPPTVTAGLPPVTVLPTDTAVLPTVPALPSTATSLPPPPTLTPVPAPPTPTVWGGPVAPHTVLVQTVTRPVFTCLNAASPCTHPTTRGERLIANQGVATKDQGAVLLRGTHTLFLLEHNAQVQFRDVTDPITLIVLAAGRLMVQHEAGYDKIVIQAGQTRIEALDTRFTLIVTHTSDIDIYAAVPVAGGTVTISGYGGQGTLAAGQQSRVRCRLCGVIFVGPTPVPPTPGPLAVEPIDPQEQQRWDQLGAQLLPVPTP